MGFKWVDTVKWIFGGVLDIIRDFRNWLGRSKKSVVWSELGPFGTSFATSCKLASGFIFVHCFVSPGSYESKELKESGICCNVIPILSIVRLHFEGNLRPRASISLWTMLDALPRYFEVRRRRFPDLIPENKKEFSSAGRRLKKKFLGEKVIIENDLPLPHSRGSVLLRLWISKLGTRSRPDFQREEIEQ